MTTTLERITREHGRLILLRTLHAQPDGTLNSGMLQDVLASFGINKSREWVHEELRSLADIGAVVTSDAGTVRIAAITRKGVDHVERRLVLEGVKRPSPEA
jgi:hypothetical protein